MKSHMQVRSRSQAGAAIIVVLSVLLMLLAIATPFLIGVRRDFVTARRDSERFRARAVADAGLDWARLELEATHQGVEGLGLGSSTPGWDGPDELRVRTSPKSWANAVAGLDRPLLNDPRGDLWAIRVRDEQSLINADSAPPFVWAAVLGRTTMRKASTPSDGAIDVASTAGFPKRNGEIVVGQERVRYALAEDDRFSGVQLRRNYPEGTQVTAALAWDLAAFNHRSPQAREQGGYAAMWNPSLAKEAAAAAGRPLREEELDRVLAPFTGYGRRGAIARWLRPTRVVADVNPQDFDEEKGGQPVRVENADWFNPGSTARLAVGGQIHDDLVVRVSGNTVWLKNAVPNIFPFDVSTLASQMRHPVNINGASREVLVMLFEGLEWSPQAGRTGNADRRVSPELAAEVAEVVIKNRPVRGMAHLAELLKAMFLVKRGEGSNYGGYASNDNEIDRYLNENFFGGEEEQVPEVDVADVQVGGSTSTTMTAEMAIAIMQNGLNPNHRFLLSSTMPYRFTSGDIFRVETEASVNDASGTELARHRQRETFRSAPARMLSLRFNSQEDFELPIVRTRRGRFVTSHPRGMDTDLSTRQQPVTRIYRYMSNFESGSRPGVYPSRTSGDLRAAPARLTTPAAGDFEEHFDGAARGAVARGLPPQRGQVPPEWILPEGLPVGRLLYDMPLNGGQGGNGITNGIAPGLGSPNSGVVADALGMVPFVVEFYVKPASFGAGPGLIDIQGEIPAHDYVRAWFDPSDRSFHFEVHDNTVDDPSAGNIVEACEVTWTPPAGVLEDDTWYHLSLHVEGCRPEAISLHVDGFKRGEARFISRLAADLAEDTLLFDVEDASDWPDHGTFWIGTELVTASRVGPNSYRCLDNQNITASGPAFAPLGRGARGTRARSHQTGETVSLFGASVALTNANSEPGEVLSAGGGTLVSPLGPFRLFAIGDDNTSTEIIPGTGGTSPDPNTPPPPPVIVRVMDLQTSAYIRLDSFLNPGAVAPELDSFQESGGYALIVSRMTDGTALSSTETMAQILRYDSRQGDRLIGLHAVGANIGASSGVAGLVVPLFTTQLSQKVVTQMQGGGTSSPSWRAAIMPLSVHLTDVSGYKPAGPQTTGGNATGVGSGIAAAAGAPQIFGEFIQLGNPQLVPTAANFANHDIEWLRYYDVDQTNGMLVNSGQTGLLTAIPAAAAMLNGSNPQPNVSVINQALRFRGQFGTDQFGYDTFSTTPRVHAGGVEAQPVFRLANASDDSPGLGYGDAVTVYSPVDAAKLKAYVTWSALPLALASDGPWALAAFSRSLGARINQVDLTQQVDYRAQSRLVKFPSGELPLINASGVASIGRGRGAAGANVPVDTLIDEVRVRGLLGREFIVWDQADVDPLGTATTTFPLAVDPTDTQIPISGVLPKSQPIAAQPLSNQGTTNYVLPDGRRIINNQAQGLPANGGLVQIGDEVIFYRRLAPGAAGGLALEDCDRGVMNTIATTHSYGDRIVFLDWRAVAALGTPLDPDGFAVNLSSTQNFDPQGGLAFVGQELLHYTELRGTSLSVPAEADADGDLRGLFRGRFGTQRGTHGTGAMVLGMPFRYWDRFARNSDHPDLGFWEFSLDEPGAFLDALHWRYRFNRPNLALRFLVRLDDRVPWNTPPEKSNGKLLFFETESGREADREVRHAIRRSGRGGAEVRVFFSWNANAFDAADLRLNDWKATPVLLSTKLDYLTQPRVLKREVLR